MSDYEYDAESRIKELSAFRHRLDQALLVRKPKVLR
jgi:hypothetical protein